jgi:hypothetical protein
VEEGEVMEARYKGLEALIGLAVGSVIRTEVLDNGSKYGVELGSSSPR